MKTLRSFAIVDYLKQRKYCSVLELQEHFKVSPATIHRDLTDLVGRDVLQRVRGGVAYVENARQHPASPYASSSYLERINWNRGAKQSIARKALECIGEGDILFLDSSTTVSYLAELLVDARFSNLTIVTNSVTIIQQFHKFPADYVRIALGGSYDIQLNAFLGQTTLRDLETLSISKAFVSGFGIDDEKVTTNHEFHAELLSKVLGMASHKYLLADSSKFKRSGLFRICSRRAFDAILSE